MNDRMKQTPIGVEVEFSGIDRGTAAAVIAKVVNGQAYYVGGTYKKYEITAPDGRTWTVMRDTSVTALHTDGTSATEFYKCEFVTPIMTYEKDIKTFQECIRKLYDAGARTNHSCGIHVHVDGSNHTVRTIWNWINLVSQRQALLNKALDIWNNRAGFCQDLTKTFVDKVNQAKPTTLGEIENLWYNEYGHGDMRTWHYNQSRYHLLNLHSYFGMSHHTVEIRAFNGSLHAGKIRAYIVLVLAMNAQALTARRVDPTPVYTGNDKFAMRTWLNRIGFIGEETKSCRKHLMANLDGCAAWRFRQPS